MTAIHHGQVNLLVFNVLLLSLIFQKKAKPWPAAFFLSLAVFIKIYPVLFVLLFIFFKRLRYLAAFAVNSAALLADQIFYNLPWGGFPFDQVRLMATLGFLGMLLHFAGTSPRERCTVQT